MPLRALRYRPVFGLPVRPNRVCSGAGSAARQARAGVGLRHRELLAALEPAYGVGIDFGLNTLGRARARHAGLNFVLGDAEDLADGWLLSKMVWFAYRKLKAI